MSEIEWEAHQCVPPFAAKCLLSEKVNFTSLSGNTSIKRQGEMVIVCGEVCLFDGGIPYVSIMPIFDKSAGIAIVSTNKLERIKTKKELWIERAEQMYSKYGVDGIYDAGLAKDIKE